MSRKKKLRLPGLPPIDVVSDARAEEAEFLVCILASDPSPFTDNLTGFCSACECKVQFRWHAPRKPKRICLGCMIKRVEGK